MSARRFAARVVPHAPELPNLRAGALMTSGGFRLCCGTLAGRDHKGDCGVWCDECGGRHAVKRGGLCAECEAEKATGMGE